MNALGIINFEDNTAHIEGLGEYRPVPAIAFMGRYRIIDFILSNMTNSGMNDVQVYCKEKPRNLMEHLGAGTSYNINSKRGKLRILFGEKSFSSPVYNTDLANFHLNMQYIEEDTNPYVVIAPSYFIYTIDFSDVVEKHRTSGADITMLYTATNEAKTKFLGCDVLMLDKEKRVTDIAKNRGNYKTRNVSLEAYVMAKSLFIDLINRGIKISSLYWFKDVLRDQLPTLDIHAYPVKGYVACLNSLPEYFRATMELRNMNIASSIFKKDWPIYTQTSDSCPTRYVNAASVKGSLVANGCVVEGTVEGSILSRNVIIHKGAVIRDSIILPGAEIGENVVLNHVVVDKYATVSRIRELEGTFEEPIYVKRRDHI